MSSTDYSAALLALQCRSGVAIYCLCVSFHVCMYMCIAICDTPCLCCGAAGLWGCGADDRLHQVIHQLEQQLRCRQQHTGVPALLQHAGHARPCGRQVPFLVAAHLGCHHHHRSLRQPALAMNSTMFISLQPWPDSTSSDDALVAPTMNQVAFK